MIDSVMRTMRLSCDEEEFEDDSKVCLGLGVEELGRRSPVFDQTEDGQTEEDNVCALQEQNHGVEVDELRSAEEVCPAPRAEPPLSVPGLTEEAVGVGHAGEREAPVTVTKLVHQVDRDHEDQRTALGSTYLTG